MHSSLGFYNRIIFLFLISGILLLAMFKIARAEEFIDINQSVISDLSPMDTNERWQSFTPTKSNLSSVSLRFLKWDSGIYFYVRIVDTVTGKEVVNNLYANIATTTPTPGYTEWFNLDFTDTEVIPGNLHKLYYKRGAGSNFNIGMAFSNVYAGGQSSINSSWDLTFKTYYDDEFYFPSVEVIEYPEWHGNILAGSEYALAYNRFNFCFLGQDCFLKYNYGYDAIGGNIDLQYEDVSIASSSLINQQYLTGQFLLDDVESEQTKEYCFVLTKGESEQKYCDVSVQWIDRSWCDEEFVCQDVATSSDFLYGVQCGFRQTICWMFNPTDNSIEYLSKNIQNFEHSFPFSLAFDFINVAKETIENSTSTGAVFGIPMVATSSEDQFYILPVMDENTIRDILSVKTVDTVTENVMYLVWAVTAGLIIFIVIKFGIL